MFENSIRGGQVFWHQLTMFKQIVCRSLSISALAGVLAILVLKAPELPKQDIPAAITYSKAQLASWWHDNKIVLHKNAPASVATIDAHDKYGLYAKNIRAHTVLHHNKFKTAHYQVTQLLISSITILIAASVSCLFLIFIIWSFFGKKAKATKLLRGGAILSANAIASKLKKRGKASHIKIGVMPLVKDAETKHILITGATGTGKTNLFHTILPQVRDKNQHALVIDQTGEMIERYYNPTRGDIIFNPFDPRSCEWDFFAEVSDPSMLNSLANSAFCNAKSSDDLWNKTSKQLFIDCVTYIASQPEPTIAKLYELISSTKLAEASKKLTGYASAALLDPAGERTAMSIRTNTIAFIEWLKHIPETGTKPSFTISSWIGDIFKTNDKRDNRSGSWIFVSSRTPERSLLRPLQSLLLDLTVLNIQSLQPDPHRRFWVVADELASLKKLEALPQSLAELRKYGGCVMTALQSLNQLYEIYGHNTANAMFGQFATKFMFRTGEPAIAKMLSDMFGSIEYKEKQENTSYGAHEHRDGISYTEQERKKTLITVEDLASLADLECFVELPNPEARLAKIKVPIARSKIQRHTKAINDAALEGPKGPVPNAIPGNNNKKEEATSPTSSDSSNAAIAYLNEARNNYRAGLEITSTIVEEVQVSEKEILELEKLLDEAAEISPREITR